MTLSTQLLALVLLLVSGEPNPLPDLDGSSVFGRERHLSAGPREVSAEQRQVFERWLDDRLSRHREGETAAGAELRAAAVDVESFFVRGPANDDFPRMMLFNEYWRVPLAKANPRRLFRRVSGNGNVARDVSPKSDRVLHSSFFTNTHIESYTPERLVREAEEARPRGKLTITKVKSSGTSEGAWAEDEEGRTYILVFDPPCCPEMTTSAEYIGSTLMRIAGFYVPTTTIITVEGTGDDLYDGRRAVATIALDDFEGGWRAGPFRDRRAVRALQLFAGWINNVDQTEQNTGLTINESGVIRHYVLDFGASLGSFTFRPQPARLGWTKLFSVYDQFTQPLYDRGWRKVPWEAPYAVVSPAVGTFSERYDPDRWRPFYENIGLLDVTPEDRRWAARRIARFHDEQIEMIVHLAGYSNRADREHVARTLKRRRDITVERYRP
ncbi:hypothetical protein Pan216_17520 [Planctomycetes bacterium Pan216]|uniref:Uncharacterized protein n=1 Tax=Kolteria novifilia TaxID=2527975 RepID=A0A518B1P1_9BACT|nr:hypothetical protein Pan216_17520 [Planctomycetes bacterium Pan216]